MKIAKITCEHEGRITWLEGEEPFNAHEEAEEANPDAVDDDSFEYDLLVNTLEYKYLRSHGITHIEYSEEPEKLLTLEEYFGGGF